MIKTHTGNEYMRDADSELMFGLAIRKTIRQQAMTIGIAAVPIPTTLLDKRITLLIINVSTGGEILYIGDSSVTTADGFPIYPRASIKIEIEDDIILYGIGSGAATLIRIIEGA